MPHLLRFLPSLALAVMLLCACESQYQDNWDRLKVGMTKTQVADLLGEPSSRYEPRADNGKVVIAEERWQYGDNLSTLATGAVDAACAFQQRSGRGAIASRVAAG